MLRVLVLLIIVYSISLSQYEIGRIPAPYNNEYVELEVGPSDVIWAGTWGDGVKKSTNQAESWSNSSNGLTNLYVGDISYKDGVLLAATQDGVFKSTNEGNSWERKSEGLLFLEIAGVAVKDENTYFAATRGNGIFRTTDGGETWEEKNNGMNFQEMRFIHITPEGNILAAKQGDGLMRSDDNGESWKTSQSGIFNKYLLSIQNLPNDEIWVSSAGQGIFQSSSDGNHWLRIDLLDNLADLNIESFTYFEHENNYYQIVGTRSKGIWNFDANWHTPKFEQTVFQWRTAHSIRTLSTGRIVVAIGAEGIAYTDTDGKSWNYPKPTNEMYNAVDNVVDAGYRDYKLAADGAKVYAAIGKKGIFKSEDYGKTWDNIGEVRDEYSKFKKFGNRLYYIYDNVNIRYSDNDGGSWSSLNLPDLEEDYWPDSTIKEYISFYDIYHKGSDIYVTYSFVYTYNNPDPESPPSEDWQPPVPKNSVFYSSNNGSSWILQNMPNDGTPMVSIESTSNGNILASTRQGLVFNSTDKGVNWLKTAGDVVRGNNLVKSLKANGNRLFAITNDWFYNTIDYGNTFNRVDYGLDAALEDFLGYVPSNEVQGLGIVNNNSYFLGLRYNFGIFRTTDNGVTFDSINNSFPCEEIRSVANNADGDVYFATTSIWKYVNPSRLDPPVLVSPANNTTNMSIVPEDPDGRPAALIEWEETEKADIYEIQVSEYEEFFNFMYKKVHAGTTAVLEDSLKYNTTYYWRVRSKVNDSYGRWSSRWSFTTELPSPKLISPEDNKIGVPINPTYTWESIPNTENYLIEVSTSLEFQDIVFSQTVTSSTFESGTYTHNELLTPSTTYYWRMKAMSDKSESRWSEYNQFTTVTGAPTLIYPEANQSEIPTEVVFKFKGVEETDVYRIQVSSDSTFKELALLILNRNTETDSTHFFDFLEFFKVYYWRVQSVLVVKNDQGVDVEYYGVWSEIRKFTTGIQPPGLLSPPNNTFDVSLTPNLQWDSFDGAVGYHVQLGKTSNFEEELIINDTINELSYQVPDGLLSNYELYYWRMRVILADNAASWVSPWRFTTIMQKSSAVNPNCGAVDMPLEFTLVWELVTGADNYRLEVSSNENFVSENIVFSKEDLSSDRIKIEEVLEEGKTYYWRTQGYNENNTGPWSEVCSFTTQMLSVRNIEKEFNFIAYPNPTKDEMKYEFTLEKASKVEIEIYDMTGLKIATLIDRPLSSGLHQINWEVGSISNGNYNLIMTVNGKSYLKLVGVSK